MKIKENIGLPNGTLFVVPKTRGLGIEVLEIKNR
jgi:hypothetical protein